ncbi:hypothetical protein [Nostoc sp. UIC 10630]|uniref:hypothetical protein n=1 Tax=Nostoc sp. UIC 10630 TaxID=2100146 RepID=UPI0013FBC1BC|nr:hypothetical protein [Nostoc sp. UIC 10630]NEU82561.1 hypothetical protein [Nostoc sp. UIC 10630]
MRTSSESCDTRLTLLFSKIVIFVAAFNKVWFSLSRKAGGRGQEAGGKMSDDALYETLRVACFSVGVRRLARRRRYLFPAVTKGNRGLRQEQQIENLVAFIKEMSESPS